MRRCLVVSTICLVVALLGALFRVYVHLLKGSEFSLFCAKCQELNINLRFDVLVKLIFETVGFLS